MKYDKSIFIFRRDLRLKDNIGLIEALKNSEYVLPIFIFTPEQLKNNKYRSENAIQFMIKSLEDLDNDLRGKGTKLFYFYGKPDDIVETLITEDEDIDAVYVNMDYTPYSKKRDSEIHRICKKNDVIFNSLEDILLNPISSIQTGGKTYTKFTPYFNKAKAKKISKPINNNYKNYVKKSYNPPKEYRGKINSLYDHNDEIAVNGGRNNGLKILREIGKFKKYNQERNLLTIDTTRLSAYIKFGCVSIREVYHTFKDKLGMHNDLIKQLYWRDFYYNVAYEFPHTFNKNGALKEKYNKLKWENNTDWYKKWCNGRTGFPIVDACMTELNTTGFMHNRGRLITGSFLVKLLLIDWNWGELYFAKRLVDYDPCVNLGNWEWIAGVGADSQPYFRIFNPWSQGKNYDEDAEYIKYWIPELEDVESKHLHQWDKYYEKYDIDYPKPMIDYSKQREKALNMYKKIFRN